MSEEAQAPSLQDFKAIECKITIESNGAAGGDWKRNTGGLHEMKRISFDGYATRELYAALIDAVGKVVGA